MIDSELFIQNVRAMIEAEKNWKDITDGHHTFRELYNQRAVLTAALANAYPNKCWKSKQHHDGTMFDGDFIVGFDTPSGQATFHFKQNYWNLFHVKVFDRAPEWDGHTPQQAIDRIMMAFC